MDTAEPGRLARLALWASQRPWHVALFLCLVAVTSAAIGLPPRVTTSAAELLPSDHPQGRALTELAEHPGATGALVVTVEGDLERLDEAVAQVQELPTVLAAQHSRDARRTTLALLQVPPERNDRLGARLRGALALGPALNPVLAAKLIDTEDTRALASLRQPEGQGRIWVVPHHHSLDAPSCVRVVEDVQAALASVDGLQIVHLGGPYANVAVGARGLERDLLRTSALSLTLVLLILTLGFRSLRVPLVLAVPLVVAALVHLAVLRLCYVAITGYAMLGTAVLFGLGVDIAIHLVERVREKRGEGASLDEALAAAWDGTGPACLAATLTSTASLAALAVGDFRGLSQLGVSLAVSLFICALLMLACLPPLLVLLDRWGALRARPIDSLPPVRSPGPVAAAGFIVVSIAAGTLGAQTLAFEYDFSVMGLDAHRYAGRPPAIQSAMEAAEPPMVAPASTYPGIEALRSGQELVGVGRVLRADTVIPADQGARLASLRELAALARDPAVQRLGPAWSAGLRQLAALPLEPLTFDDLPVELRGVLAADQLVLLPDRSLHDLRDSAALVDALAEVAPTATGVRLIQGASYQVIVADAPRILAAASGAILLFTVLGLRRPGSVVLVVASVAVGCAWSVAIVSALGVRLTIGNLVGFPILVGIGIDVAIHVVHRMRDEQQSFARALATVGRAAALSTATTSASFGAVSIASTGGLRSLGTLVGLGLPVMTLASLALLGLLRPRGG